MPKIDTITLDKDGKLPSHAWPGCYPLFYLDQDNNTLCPSCSNIFRIHDYLPNRPVFWEVYYEGPSLTCEECDAQIESAYGDPQEDEEEESLDRYVLELERNYNDRRGE